MISNFIDKETGEFKENPVLSIEDIYRKFAYHGLQRNHKVMEKSIEVIFDNMLPFTYEPFFKDVDKEFTITYEEIKIIGKMNKYQRTDYLNKRNLLPVEAHMTTLGLSPNQFEFLKDIFFGKEREIKKKTQIAVECLTKAFNLIIESTYDLYMIHGAMVKSHILKDKQIFNTHLRSLIEPHPKDPTYEVWDIKKNQKEFYYDLTKDTVLGKYAKDNLQEEDLTHTHYATAYTMRTS